MAEELVRALGPHPVPRVHRLAGDDRRRHAAEVAEERRAAEPADGVGGVRAPVEAGGIGAVHAPGERRRGPPRGAAARGVDGRWVAHDRAGLRRPGLGTAERLRSPCSGSPDR